MKEELIKQLEAIADEATWMKELVEENDGPWGYFDLLSYKVSQAKDLFYEWAEKEGIE